ncbi:MAG: L-histidine N(alpha)-methyltransferase [Bacteroidota bacterium]
MVDQTLTERKTFDITFFNDVCDGLSQNPKRISSKYFYDERGDTLFQQIMHLEEYYPMNCEYEIFTTHKEAILNCFIKGSRGFNLIEYGAGDAYKTKVLINHFISNQVDFIYSPVDISDNVLNILENSLLSKFPELHLDKIAAEYFDALDVINKRNCDKKVILFLGSNIGNFTWEETDAFFHSISDKGDSGDLLMIGFDLQKDPGTILKAYNDSKGVTRDFNLNLLQRINNELDADFNINGFYHYPTYDPISGEAKSFIVSKTHQTVSIGNPAQTFTFKAGECIFTEVSRKYTEEQIDALAEKTGFKVVEKYFDKKHYFCDAILEVL